MYYVANILWFVCVCDCVLVRQMERVLWDGEMCRYRVRVITGNRLGASTKAQVKLVLCGDLGRTEEIELKHSKNHKVMFQKGQVRA